MEEKTNYHLAYSLPKIAQNYTKLHKILGSILLIALKQIMIIYRMLPICQKIIRKTGIIQKKNEISILIWKTKNIISQSGYQIKRQKHRRRNGIKTTSPITNLKMHHYFSAIDWIVCWIKLWLKLWSHNYFLLTSSTSTMNAVNRSRSKHHKVSYRCN